MIEAKTKSMERQGLSNKSVMLGIIVVFLAVLGLYGYNAFRAGKAASSGIGNIHLTQSALEENYGLRVQLIAVTAAGGLVDLRLQIVDAEKAKAFLADRANFPAVQVGSDVILRAAEDVATQEIQFENGKSIFVLFSNTGNILKPGNPVNIIFGNQQLETIQSQ